MTLEHNFPVGTQLATQGYTDWVVRERMFADPVGRIPVTFEGASGARYSAVLSPADIVQVLGFPEPKTDTAAFNLAVAELAAKFKHSIGFTYVNATGKRKYHVVEITSITPAQEQGKTLIVGLDEDANDYRSFRLERIVDEVELYG